MADLVETNEETITPEVVEPQTPFEQAVVNELAGVKTILNTYGQVFETIRGVINMHSLATLYHLKSMNDTRVQMNLEPYPEGNDPQLFREALMKLAAEMDELRANDEAQQTPTEPEQLTLDV